MNDAEKTVLTDLPGADTWANSPHSQLLVSRMRAVIDRLRRKESHTCSCGGECSRASGTELSIAREQIRLLGAVIAEIEFAAGREVSVWDAAPLPPTESAHKGATEG